jgi:phage recombination protein Bet
MVKQDALAKATEATAIELTPKTIKTYINQYATEQEVALFLNQCVMFGLNPFKREIYLIKYSANQPATFVVGYEVYLKRAERSDKWAGLESGTTGEGKDLKAWAKVYRKDWTNPLYHEVYLDEYIQKTKEGQPTRFWHEKPRTMLKKVAISQAFRMAFPDEFAGMPYTDAEMPVDHSKLPATEVKAEVVDPRAELEADGEVVNEAPVGKFDKLSKFQEAKRALGDRVYYDCLGQFGFEKSNQVPPEQREAILKIMRTMYKDLHPAPAQEA